MAVSTLSHHFPFASLPTADIQQLSHPNGARFEELRLLPDETQTIRAKMLIESLAQRLKLQEVSEVPLQTLLER
ncbi:MAG: hypothetical protein KR126chlam3_01589, partial [Chlamydiae bacterium]|nr:hypothetical protein [Chlamydiota bacterium]